jgi:hypothetical protein
MIATAFMEFNKTALISALFAVKQPFPFYVALPLPFSFIFIIPIELPIGMIHPDRISHSSLFPPKVPIHLKINSSKYLFYQLMKLLNHNV